jgi:hypothetical protein
MATKYMDAVDQRDALLEALKAITAAPDLRTYGLAMQNARAAIARAEGEQP